MALLATGSLQRLETCDIEEDLMTYRYDINPIVLEVLERWKLVQINI